MKKLASKGKQMYTGENKVAAILLCQQIKLPLIYLKLLLMPVCACYEIHRKAQYCSGFSGCTAVRVTISQTRVEGSPTANDSFSVLSISCARHMICLLLLFNL